MSSIILCFTFAPSPSLHLPLPASSSPSFTSCCGVTDCHTGTDRRRDRGWEGEWMCELESSVYDVLSLRMLEQWMFCSFVHISFCTIIFSSWIIIKKYFASKYSTVASLKLLNIPTWYNCHPKHCNHPQFCNATHQHSHFLPAGACLRKMMWPLPNLWQVLWVPTYINSNFF